ncbi:MAG: hypothetical protein ACI3XQ_06540 [Eubacteriales bacterium]
MSSLLYWLKSEGFVIVGVDLDAQTAETGLGSEASLHIDFVRRNPNDAEEK